MHSLEQFVYESSIAGDTCGLQKYWTEFVRKFGADGYRIVPASLQLLQLVYSLIKIENKPRLRWLWPSPRLSKQPDTVIDFAHKTPPGWREYYNVQRLYRYDPILTKWIVHRGPFTKDEARADFSSPETERLNAITKEFGHHNNIAMSHWLGPDMLVGVSLYIPSAKIHLDDVTKRVLQTASYLFCARHQELSTVVPNLDEAPQLTPRELDVLRWIALGRTKQEIAERLCVSTSCIKRHCENVSLKLGVNNMASAVARAMSYGLIVL